MAFEWSPTACRQWQHAYRNLQVTERYCCLPYSTEQRRHCLSSLSSSHFSLVSRSASTDLILISLRSSATAMADQLQNSLDLPDHVALARANKKIEAKKNSCCGTIPSRLFIMWICESMMFCRASSNSPGSSVVIPVIVCTSKLS